MLCEHTLTFVAACPMNDARDVYEVTFRLDRFISVEELQTLAQDYVDSRIFQEDLTQELANHVKCEVESHGTHGNVRSRVVCQPEKNKTPPSERKNGVGGGRR